MKTLLKRLEADARDRRVPAQTLVEELKNFEAEQGQFKTCDKYEVSWGSLRKFNKDVLENENWGISPNGHNPAIKTRLTEFLDIYEERQNTTRAERDTARQERDGYKLRNVELENELAQYRRRETEALESQMARIVSEKLPSY